MTDHVGPETLARFREGLLTADETAAVGAHLAGCDRCGQTGSQLTFVSGLLAAAPTPPMPPALSARIEAAIAAEAAGRAAAAATPPTSARTSTGPAASGPPAAGPPGSVAAGAGAPGGSAAAQPPPVPHGTGPAPGRAGTAPGQRSGAGTGPPAAHPPPRATRRPGRSRARLRAMAAAAAIAVIGGGGYAVSQLASQGGPAGQAASASAARPAASRPGAPAAGMVPNNPAGQQPPIAAVSSGTRYTARGFSRQVRTVLARYPAGSAQRQPASGLRGFPATGIAACVNAVTGGQRPRLVDIASYRGKPAMIIVVSGSGTAPARAWVVAPDCTATRPDVVARITLPGLR